MDRIDADLAFPDPRSGEIRLTNPVSDVLSEVGEEPRDPKDAFFLSGVATLVAEGTSVERTDRSRVSTDITSAEAFAPLTPVTVSLSVLPDDLVIFRPPSPNSREVVDSCEDVLDMLTGADSTLETGSDSSSPDTSLMTGAVVCALPRERNRSVLSPYLDVND